MVQRPGADTAPELVLETAGGSTEMSSPRTYHVGRDPLCEICLDDARVSWHHAVLCPDGDHWTVRDEDSTNGTWADGHRIHEWSVGPGSELRFGSAQDGPRAVLSIRTP
ncbi:FHA domain-containing protein, partial [Streptomyces lavendulae]|uniref:FHA domain-containing protein n=1 Tax=Streptomyces lavendulae TaxID=1914 RepID=UPI0031EA1A83